VITDLRPEQMYPVKIDVSFTDVFNGSSSPLSRKSTILINSKYAAQLYAESIKEDMLIENLPRTMEALSIAKICSFGILGMNFTTVGAKAATNGDFSSAVNHVRFDFVDAKNCGKHVFFDLISPRHDIFCDAKRYTVDRTNTLIIAFADSFCRFLKDLTELDWVLCSGRRGSIKRKECSPF
jgi:hypothetical protein